MFAYCVVDGGIELTNNYDPFDSDFFTEGEQKVVAEAILASMMVFDTGVAVYAINPKVKNDKPRLLVNYRDRSDDVPNGE